MNTKVMLQKALMFSLILICAGELHGQILISQLPGNTSGSLSDVQLGFSSAENFVVGGNGVTIESIRFWGMYSNSNVPLSTDDFEFSILPDSSGLPSSTSLASGTGIAPDRADTGVDVLGIDQYEYNLDLSSTPIVLAAGTYWLEMFNNAGPDDGVGEHWHWITAQADSVSGIPGFARAFETPGSTWSINENFDLAFEIGISTVGVEDELTPELDLQLYSAYPNPSSAGQGGFVTFTFRLGADSESRLELFNVLGQSLQTLHDGPARAGMVHTVRFDSSKLPVGNYFYRLTTSDKTRTRVFAVVK